MKTAHYSLPLIILLCIGSFIANAQNTGRYNLGTSRQFLENLKKELPSNAKPGAAKISLKTSSAVEFTGLINSRREWDGGIFMAGKLDSVPDGSFFIRIENFNEITGHILIKSTEEAYVYGSDEDGNIYIEEEDIHEVLCIDYLEEEATGETEDVTDGTDTGYTAALLESLPGANGVILLDFDGQYVSGTAWNDGATIDAQPSGMSEAMIQEVWELVSEDFKPFNLNITTDESVFNSYPLNRRMRVVVTPTDDAAPGAGGVAYVNSFTWNDNTPCWVFITTRAKRCGEAASHEIGHTLGLRHDGTSSEEYFTGHGSWAPIMGSGYSRSVSQWSKGEYTDANNTEDDLARISRTYNGLGYRIDDHGNGLPEARALTIDAGGVVSAAVNTGLIEQTSDIDMFSFTITGGTVALTFNPAARHADLDILVKLYNSSGTILGEFNPTGLAAAINQNFGAGTYYVSVEGTGAGDPLSTGYSSYGSLGAYSISGTIPAVVVAQDPYGGNLWPIPGKIEAENYDEGGMNVSFFDSSEPNEGGDYRADAVDIDATTSETFVTHISQGEWLEYSVEVAEASFYQLKARVSSATESGSFRLDFNNTNITGTITVPNTGGSQSWIEIEDVFELQPGTQIMRLYAETGGFNIDFMNFTAVQLDCNMDVNGTASVDACGLCSGGNTGILPCAGQIEGETICDWSDGTISTTSTDYSGSGYFNFTNATGSTGYWPLNADSEITTTLTFRYSNGSTNSRNTNLMINGTVQEEIVSFSPTGGWSAWSTVSVQVSLTNGNNILEMVSLMSEGGPHIDLFYYSSELVSLGSCTTPEDCNGVLGGTASIDSCGVCSGGNTGIVANSTCEKDCEGIWNGSAYTDDCSVCVEGTTGLLPCAQIAEGNYIIKPVSSILCLEGTAEVTQESCTNAPEQVWNITKTGNHYQISTLTGSYITISNATQGTALSLSTVSENIEVRIEEAGNGNYHIKPAGDYHLFFDVYGNSLSPGAAIILWPATGGSNQVFELTPATVTGIQQLTSSNVIIYPNPAESKLTIVNGTGNWILKDVTETEVLRGTGKEADLSTLSSGLYFLLIDGKSHKIVKK